MEKVNNLLHTYGTKYLSEFNPSFPIKTSNNNAKALKLEALEKQFYQKFGENTYAGFMKKIKDMFNSPEGKADAEALQRFQNEKLRSSLLTIEGEHFNPYSEKFEVSIQLNNANIPGVEINKAIKRLTSQQGWAQGDNNTFTTIIELNREGFRKIANNIFGAKTQKGKKSFAKIRESLVQGLQNSEDLLSFKIVNGDGTSYGKTEFLQSMERNARQYPWGFTKEELIAADKDPDEKSKLRRELKKAKEIIYQYIFTTLLSGASQTLVTCANQLWNEKLGGKFENLSFFTTGGATFMNGIIGALGEFQFALFTKYIAAKFQASGVSAEIIGDLQKDVQGTIQTIKGEKGKTDVQIFSNLGVRWGAQIKNYNYNSKNDRIATNIHPNAFADLAGLQGDTREDFLTFIANYIFNLDYMSKASGIKSQLDMFFNTQLAAILSLEAGNQMTDTVAFYFIGGQYLVPGSVILRAAANIEHSILGAINITGSPRHTETDMHKNFVTNERKKEPDNNLLYRQYWTRENANSPWTPTEKNRSEFTKMVTNIISIKTNFNYKEILERNIKTNMSIF